MSAQYSEPRMKSYFKEPSVVDEVRIENVSINNVVLDNYSRPAVFFNQQTSPETSVDVGGANTCVIQTQNLTTIHDTVTNFQIENLGKVGRNSWVTGDFVKVTIMSYSGYDGLPWVTGYKISGSGNYYVNIANVVKTGDPVTAWPLNGQVQLCVEYKSLNGLP